MRFQVSLSSHTADTLKRISATSGQTKSQIIEALLRETFAKPDFAITIKLETGPTVVNATNASKPTTPESAPQKFFTLYWDDKDLDGLSDQDKESMGAVRR